MSDNKKKLDLQKIYAIQNAAGKAELPEGAREEHFTAGRLAAFMRRSIRIRS